MCSTPGCDCPSKEPCPTPRQIAKRAARIRQTWNARERAKRMGFYFQPVKTKEMMENEFFKWIAAE